MSKPKVIISLSKDRAGHAGLIAQVLRKKFGAFEVVPGIPGTFDFTVVQLPERLDIIAEGAAWALPGNQRPALGTMVTWAEGYAQGQADTVAAFSADTK